jgi:O-antigen/teichoic acid export membrane protein
LNDLAYIRKKAISGFFWSLTENGGSYFLQFFIGLVLVRLIHPIDYGIIGMMTIFIALGNEVSNSGLSTAIIQKISPTNEDYSTVFIIQTTIGFFYFLILVSVSSLVAKFYVQPEITSALKLFALCPFISAIGIIQITIIYKTLNYRRFARINLTSLVFAGIIAIIFAFYGYGVYALVMFQLVQNSLSTIQLWILGGWSHGFKFSKKSYFDLLKFSKSLLFINIINSLYTEIYNSLIGKFFKAAQLGYYLRAKQTTDIFSLQFTNTFNKVMLPVFSNLQDDSEALKSALRKVLIMTGFLNFSILAFMSANAEPFFVLLFTDKWNSAIPFFKILCIEGMFMPIHVTIGNLLLARGKSGLFMKIGLAKRAFQALVIILTLSSITNLIYGQLFVSIIFTMIGFFISKKELQFDVWDQIKILIPYSILAFVVYFINYFSFEFIYGLSHFKMIMLNLLISLTVYIPIAYLFKLEAFTNIHEILFEKFKIGNKK